MVRLGKAVTPISVVLPCLDEEAILRPALQRLQGLRESGHELILVDGGSRDASVERARGWVDQILRSAPGRAHQMNAGARAASHRILWFLHLDSVVPPAADGAILEALGAGACWGRFEVRLSGGDWRLRVIERTMNLRSRITGIATGDQGIFVTQDCFEAVGGFPPIALMEDIALSRLLKRRGRPACIARPLVTSSRRWEQRGILRTVLLMWRLRLAYALGVAPERLARLYGTCTTPRGPDS